MTFFGNPILCKVGLPEYVDFSIANLEELFHQPGIFSKQTIRGPVGTWDPSGPLKPPPGNWITRVLEVLFFSLKKVENRAKISAGKTQPGLVLRETTWEKITTEIAHQPSSGKFRRTTCQGGEGKIGKGGGVLGVNC